MQLIGSEIAGKGGGGKRYVLGQGGRQSGWGVMLRRIEALFKSQHVWRTHVETTQPACKGKGAAVQQNEGTVKVLNWGLLMMALISATLRWPCH